MLYSRSLLVIHFKYKSVYMFIPRSLTTPFPPPSPQSHLVRLRAYLWLAFPRGNTLNTERWEDCQFSICKQKPPASPGTFGFKKRGRQIRQRRESDSLKRDLPLRKKGAKGIRKEFFFFVYSLILRNIYPHSTVLQALC